MMLDCTLTHMFIHLHPSNNVCVKQKKNILSCRTKDIHFSLFVFSFIILFEKFYAGVLN